MIGLMEDLKRWLDRVRHIEYLGTGEPLYVTPEELRELRDLADRERHQRELLLGVAPSPSAPESLLPVPVVVDREKAANQRARMWLARSGELESGIALDQVAKE